VFALRCNSEHSEVRFSTRRVSGARSRISGSPILPLSVSSVGIFRLASSHARATKSQTRPLKSKDRSPAKRTTTHSGASSRESFAREVRAITAEQAVYRDTTAFSAARLTPEANADPRTGRSAGATYPKSEAIPEPAPKRLPSPLVEEPVEARWRTLRSSEGTPIALPSRLVSTP
jgi:hypothetical protein